VLKSRIRSIVGEAVGAEGGVGFMGSMGGGKATDRTTARMNYNLDDDAYNLMQLSEGYIAHLCSLLDELLLPLRSYLAPRLWDNLLLTVLGTVSKRLETSQRKCDFTSLGALALDTDMRDLLSYTKDKLYGAEYQSTLAITKACPAFSRLLQISKLLNVDDLEDVLDLISSLKRKNNWDIKLEDAKAFLGARVEFEASRVQELLRIPDDN
jgi:conserved oligomeric Golgi complex subunit 4